MNEEEILECIFFFFAVSLTCFQFVNKQKRKKTTKTYSEEQQLFYSIFPSPSA